MKKKIGVLALLLTMGIHASGCNGNRPVAPGYKPTPTATTALILTPTPTLTPTSTPILSLPTLTPII